MSGKAEQQTLMASPPMDILDHLRSADYALNPEGPGQGGAVTSSDLEWARHEIAAALGRVKCEVDHGEDGEFVKGEFST